MWVVKFSRGQERCEACPRRGTLRWTNGDLSCWRCVRHSIRLLTMGA